jgi:hypothetical protein
MSKALKILHRSRRFTLLAGMVALLTLSFLVSRPPDALAVTSRLYICTFYTDASLTDVTGYVRYDCNGTIVRQSGTVTAYRTYEYGDCCYDPCCGGYYYWC